MKNGSLIQIIASLLLVAGCLINLLQAVLDLPAYVNIISVPILVLSIVMHAAVIGKNTKK
jgi:hypothetical protein